MKFKTTTKDLLKDIVLKQYKLEEEFKDKAINVEITKYSESRSLLQNKYYWAILDAIAKCDKSDIKKPKDLHEQYIVDYGVPIAPDKEDSIVMMLEEALPFFKETFPYLREIGRKETDSKTLLYMQAMKGSSQMTMNEMYHLILAVIQEAEDLGLEIDNEKQNLLEYYEKHGKKIKE